jgi:hypothetical protein
MVAAQPLAATGNGIHRHTVKTLGFHATLSGWPPTPDPGFRGANCLFSTRWREGSVVKYIVFRNLEGKTLKTVILPVHVCEVRAGRDAAAGPREIHTSQLQVSGLREVIGKGVNTEGADNKGESMKFGRAGP